MKKNSNKCIRFKTLNFLNHNKNRAFGNIYSKQSIISSLFQKTILHHDFKNIIALYYFIDITTAMQCNDNELRKYAIEVSGKNIFQVGVINYDLNNQMGEKLFGVIHKNVNDVKSIWKWKLVEYLTAYQIYQKYSIKTKFLPSSSRTKLSYINQLYKDVKIDADIIETTDWRKMKQFRGGKVSRQNESRQNESKQNESRQNESRQNESYDTETIIVLKLKQFIYYVNKSFHKSCLNSENIFLPLIPICIIENNKNYIEFVKIVYLEAQNVHIGVACRYNELNEKCYFTSIYLDKPNLEKKFQLAVDKKHHHFEKYKQQLNVFKIPITELRFHDEQLQIKEQINAMYHRVKSLRKQYYHQKKLVENLNNILLNSSQKQLQNMNMENKEEEKTPTQELSEILPQLLPQLQQLPQLPQILPSIAYELPELPSKIFFYFNEFWQNHNYYNDPMEIPVLDIRKSVFVTHPIGAKHNIFINKNNILIWLKSIIEFSNFNPNDFIRPYYYLDFTIALQMIDKEASTFVGKLPISIVNVDLHDIHGMSFYGVINDFVNKENSKYKYELITLMTKSQLHNLFGIKENSLPSSSRLKKTFVNKLILPRYLEESDILNIKWNKIKYEHYSEFRKAMDLNSETKILKISKNRINNYCLSALKIQENNMKYEKNPVLIPILIISKFKFKYHIEWVLIINIIHEKQSIGVSFRYNPLKDKYNATTIFVNKNAIQSRHQLIGLRYDFCNYLHPINFSLKEIEIVYDAGEFDDFNSKQLMRYQKVCQEQSNEILNLQNQLNLRNQLNYYQSKLNYYPN